ncbi:MAG: DNA-processing protein DprA [Firmicutes bacterium]|nr:DNA-processing protein DprA [Bacillota bacterium]
MVPDRVIWIWLSLALGAGSKIPNKLFASFDTLAEIYSSPKERFLEIEGVNEVIAEKLADKDVSRAENILSVCIKRRWGLITYGDKAYPRRLKSIPDPPLVLYYRGRFIDLNDQVCVAVVGTRRMTEYGEGQAYSLSYSMASGGALIVSGLALGCDSMAANGALDAGAPTVAVLGCGIDRIYPAEHKTLAEHIMRSGMIMTEYTPGEQPLGFHFPARNRIISGLSQGTVVIEAPVGSGALITARTALLQGRDLFAVPGDLRDENSAGCNELIKGGARVVTSVSDIMSVYEFTYPHRISVSVAERAESSLKKNAGQETAKLRGVSSRQPKEKEPKEKEPKPEKLQKSKPVSELPKATANAPEAENTSSYSFRRDREEAERIKNAKKESATELPITDREREILSLIKRDGSTPDELTGDGRSASDVMSALTVLEILGCVAAVPGGRYIKTQ